MDMVAGRVWADERRPIRHIDLLLLVLTAALVVVGLFLLYSATASTLRGEGFDAFSRVKKQAITVVLGVVIALVITAFDYRFFKVYAGFIYVAMVVALILVRIPGIGATDASGVAQRYFGTSVAGGFQITPSEFAKVIVIVMLAAVLSELRTAEPTVADLAKVLAVAAVPLILVFLQPDIGTSIALSAIVVGMLVVAGTRLKHLLVLTAAGLVLIFLTFQLGVIKDFQRERLTAFLDRSNA